MARKMVEKILEHRQNHETSSAHSKTVREFTKEINLYCKVVTTVYIAGALLYCTVSAHLTLNNPEECDREYVHLVIGWVHNSKYYFVLLFLNALCMFILFTTVFQWFLIVYCMILKIKCQIRLLCSDLDAINDYFDEFKNYVESNPSDGLVGRLKTSLNLSRKNANETEQFEGKTKSALTSLSLLKFNRGKFIEEQIKLYFKSIVQQHIQIIENVKVADITFRLSMMISVQLGVMIVAMTIPGLGGNVPTQELFHRGIEVLEIIGSIGLFNYFGQMVIDQSVR
ncbi:uncharacterized protein LOC129003333 [Macrosteles quadrilineatus]|uniref:uncharacterized protein LOC129003333 n=1 Tax=Macrosteles quadrilineatus TaxID=74068 RepID=UPI0023E1DD05|nr:uncharacterized protein LOC129003333 [Macrosteles quadrilineatus]